jgi:uracil-DNA glycosylase
MTNRVERIGAQVWATHLSDDIINIQELYTSMVDTDQHDKCTLCPIHKECTAPVPGVGNVDAKILFIGRNPGEKEDYFGTPFVGPGGRLLNKFMERAGITANNVFITNLVKCYTRKNRAPETEEVNICMTNWLARELSYLNPKLIVTFGSQAAQAVLGYNSLMDNRLKSKTTKFGHYTFVACIHPGAALRQGSYYQSAALRQGSYYQMFMEDADYVGSVAKQLGVLE